MVTMKYGEYVQKGTTLTNIVAKVNYLCLHNGGNGTNPIPSSIVFTPYFGCNQLVNHPTSAMINPVGDEIFTVYTFLAFLGLLFASINIFGGFLITHRMLKMFTRR